MLNVVGWMLLVLGVIVAPLAGLVAFGTLMDMDPPYESPQPWGWVAVGGCVAIYLGSRCLWAAHRGPTERLPDYWADGR